MTLVLFKSQLINLEKGMKGPWGPGACENLSLVPSTDSTLTKLRHLLRKSVKIRPAFLFPVNFILKNAVSLL